MLVTVYTCHVFACIDCELSATHDASLLVSCLAAAKKDCKLSPSCLPVAYRSLVLQAISDDNFHVGFNRIYDKNLARSLRKIFKKHAHLYKGLEDKYDLDLAANCDSIRGFDDAITRRTFGRVVLLHPLFCWGAPDVLIECMMPAIRVAICSRLCAILWVNEQILSAIMHSLAFVVCCLFCQVTCVSALPKG